MKNIYAVLVGILVLAISGCSKPAESVVRAGADFEVGKLFTVDSCTVYRFSDAGYSRYFTNCNGQTMTQQSAGKSSYPENISGGYYP